MSKPRPRSRKASTVVDRSDRMLAGQLRRAIEASGRTHYDIGKAAEVDPGIVARFAQFKRDVSLASAGKICAALGLRLAANPRKGRMIDPPPSALAPPPDEDTWCPAPN